MLTQINSVVKCIAPLLISSILAVLSELNDSGRQTKTTRVNRKCRLFIKGKTIKNKFAFC